MSNLASSISTLLLMSFVGWTVIHGMVGSAIAQMNGRSRLTGFILSSVIPIPFVGWYVTWAVTNSSQES